MAAQSFLSATTVRRSILTLKPTSPIPNTRIVEIVTHAIKHAPSPFNVQSCRAIVLFQDEHRKLWDIAKDTVRNTMPAQVFAVLEPKIEEYRNGYGTVLFMEDPNAEFKLPPWPQGILAKNRDWYDHSNGMNQFIVWTALCAEGLGCNLQHYSPQLSDQALSAWAIHPSWKMRAQLVFGTPDGPPRGGWEKTFAPLEGRVMVFGQQQEEEEERLVNGTS